MRRVILYFFVFIIITYCIAPFLWTVITSVKPHKEIFSATITYLPSKIDLENFVNILFKRPFIRYVMNSVIVASISTILTLIVSSLCAYAIVRMTRYSGVFERSTLIFALFPPTILVIPLYELMRLLGLINSYASLILCYSALNLPFGIWMLVSSFRSIPFELEEAALIDGYSRIGILFKIILPLAAPAIAAASILLFIFSWNEFLLALTFMTDENMFTVPVGISLLSGASVYEIPWGEICAAVVLTTLPVILAILLFQKLLISGLTEGAIKG